MFRRYPRGIITANALTGTSGVYDISESLKPLGPIALTYLSSRAVGVTLRLRKAVAVVLAATFPTRRSRLRRET